MKTIGDLVEGMFEDACCECGRKVGKNPKYVHLSIDGAILPPDADVANSQGNWAIGSKCADLYDPKVLIGSK